MVALTGNEGCPEREGASGPGAIPGSWIRPDTSTSLLLSTLSVFLSILYITCVFEGLCFEIYSVPGQFVVRFVFLLFGFFFINCFAGVVMTAWFFPAFPALALTDGIDPCQTLQAVDGFDKVIIIVRHL
jgi:hypothetical protein